MFKYPDMVVVVVVVVVGVIGPMVGVPPGDRAERSTRILGYESI